MDATTHILEACGGTLAVAQAIGAPHNTVVYWRRRKSIPARHWRSIVALAEQVGAEGVTFEALASRYSTGSI